jgi:hypothetical protein
MENPLVRAVSLWQGVQLALRIGRTFSSKVLAASGHATLIARRAKHRKLTLLPSFQYSEFYYNATYSLCGKPFFGLEAAIRRNLSCM